MKLEEPQMYTIFGKKGTVEYLTKSVCFALRIDKGSWGGALHSRSLNNNSGGYVDT